MNLERARALIYREVWSCSPPVPCPCWASRWTSGRLWRTHSPGTRAAVSGMTCTPCRVTRIGPKRRRRNIPLLNKFFRSPRFGSAYVPARGSVSPLSPSRRTGSSLPSCRAHVAGKQEDRLPGACARPAVPDLRPVALRASSFSPPLIIPARPPIRASACTSLSHRPAAGPWYRAAN